MEVSLKLRFRPDFWLKHEKFTYLDTFQYTKNYKNAFFSKGSNFYFVIDMGNLGHVTIPKKK